MTKTYCPECDAEFWGGVRGGHEYCPVCKFYRNKKVLLVVSETPRQIKTKKEIKIRRVENGKKA
jgi:hypothetical protein